MHTSRASSPHPVVLLGLLAACGGGPASGTAGAGGEAVGGQGGTDVGGSAGSGGTNAGGAGGASGGSGGAGPIGDPNQDGPYSFEAVQGETTVASTGDVVPISGYVPTAGPTAGPYPVVVVAHGFQLPTTQYDGYARRLASFGYIALLPDYPASFFGLSHVDVAEDLLGALDWAAAAPELAGQVDARSAGMAGHSLGGKAALLAATLDARVAAVLALDPVDSSMSCSPQDCPDVSELMPTLAIPTGFLGETLDAAGGFQPCAPEADNYATFYAGASAPSFAVTVIGANHMSFLDDPSTCGFTCSFCQPATADASAVTALAHAYTAAFFERTLRGDAGYQTYLTGAEAEMRYVATGLATIEQK